MIAKGWNLEHKWGQLEHVNLMRIKINPLIKTIPEVMKFAWYPHAHSHEWRWRLNYLLTNSSKQGLLKNYSCIIINPYTPIYRLGIYGSMGLTSECWTCNRTRDPSFPDQVLLRLAIQANSRNVFLLYKLMHRRFQYYWAFFTSWRSFLKHLFVKYISKIFYMTFFL